MTAFQEQGILEKRIVTEFPHKVKKIEHCWIPLTDGTKLAARMWLPEASDSKPMPAVLEYIPYRKRDGTRSRDEPMHGYISGHGYAVVRVDMRGSGESDGLLRDEYLKGEQDDALEVIEWISRQPWCDGNVGMMGKSWGGFNSLQVAARRPPALKAIIVVGFTDDRYNDDIHYKGGCLLNDNLWWGAIMLAYQSRPIDPQLDAGGWREKWSKRLEEMPHWPKLWMDHPLRDEYWKHGSICEDYSAIRCPVLAFDGWVDSYTNTVLRIMENLDVPRRAVIGPWGHLYAHDGAPAPAVGFLQEAVRWWDRWLKGAPNDAMDAPMVQAWMEGCVRPSAFQPVSPGRWVKADSWPTELVKECPLHLDYGKLTDKISHGAGTVLLKTQLAHGLLSGEWMGAGVPGESPGDQRMDDGMAMVFDSEILPDDVEIFGYPRLEVELSSDKPCAMLFAQISDISPDGAATQVSYGVMNLSHLEGHDKFVPLVPGKKVKSRVNLDCIAHCFPAGHRIRLSLATTFWPMFWPMPEEASLSIDLSTGTLFMPVFTEREKCVGPIPQPESAPLTPVTVLSEGYVGRSISYDILADTWTCVTDGVGGVFGEGVYRFDEVGITVEHNLKRELTVKNGDPLSAKYNLYQKMKIGGEGWLAEADIVTSMSCDKTNFFVKSEMTVKENGAEMLTKKWDDTVARIGL
ncbi:MAG: CocE/NonD family hydrolase [Synergistaceae bacterium]|jgi:putative CocE/NonD family hydrolase|nr:CocE/NonD family hydrolase [Synergistaceae bacterium]